MKGSEIQSRMGALAMRKGDLNAATAAQQNAKTLAIDEAVQSYMADYDKNPQAFTDHLLRSANLDTKSLSVARDKKTGYFMVHTIGPDGDASAHKLNSAQVRQLALSEAYLRAGAHEKGLQLASGVNKDIAEAIARDNGIQLQSAQLNNTAAHYAAQDSRDQQRLGLYARSVAQATKPKEYMIENDQGQRAVFTPKFDANGQAILPHGWRFAMEDGQRGGKGLGLTKLDPAGTMYRDGNGSVVKLNDKGQYVSPDAPDTADGVMQMIAKTRPSLLKKYQGMISVAPDGLHLIVGSANDYRGARPDAQIPMFDPRDPKDLAELETTLDTQVAGDARANEVARALQKSGKVGAWRSGNPAQVANEKSRGPAIAPYSVGF